ncbi:uncharacterized protein LOC118466262 [Anopheles albimanus]|uniref:uncharacterized protein LOC118466262 n=1 Tax=Anopheles albimanus TaxID=7167 RepID=UPI00163EB916|nr:uncharacterized protein LOC118466262 [Anopheles albimanus]
MDLEGSELSALEEQLYSSIHHTFDESANQDGNMQWPQSFVGATSTPSRVVSNTSVMNNIQPRASKMKRYWAPNTPQQTANPVRSFTRDQTEARGIAKSATHPNQSMAAIPRQQAGTQQTSTEHSTGDPKRSLFAPYQSLLSSWQLQRNPDGTGNAESNPVSNGAQSPGTKEKKRKKKQSPKHPVEKKLASLVSLVEEAEGEQKEAAKQRIQAKKSKATAVRNKLADKACSKLRVVAEISLDSSDDETRAPSRTAKLKPSSVPPSDDDTTDVELIPAPPPPKICIDCSDDEVAQDSFVLPKSKRTKKKKEPKNASSPRCLSPSNSSIISDDFIGHNDRSRLNESFTDTIPNDDELETECLLRESLQTNRKSRSMTKERNKRVPSVSSDGTVGTASDATDQDRRTSDISGGKTPKGVLLPTSGSKTGRSDEISGGNAPLGKPSQNDEQMVLKTKSKVKKSAAASGHGRSKSHSPASQGPMAENHLMIEEKNATARANTVEQPPVPKGKTKPKNKANQSYSTAGIDTAVSSNKAGKAASKPSLRSKHDPESESMYQEISKISNKPKNDTVCYDDSSVSSESDYNITFISNKSSANATESRKGGSGNEEANGTIVLDRMQDVSSESDIEEFLQRSSKEPTGSIKKPTAESAKAAKKRSTGTKRRKKYNSENLSDEEFACMLTDIVQAVSDGDDDDDDDDDEDNLEFEVQGIEPTTQVPDQNAAVSEGIEATAQPPPEQQQSTTEEKGKKKKRRRVASTSDHTTTVTLSDTDDDVVEISDVSTVNEVMDDSSIPSNATLMTTGVSRPGWNKEMDLFYNSSKTESQFCMRRIMEDMPREADQWKIVDKDRYPDPPKRGKPCHNCGEQGHMRYKCQNAPKPLVCRICGKQGHHEPRCPMTICLNCGSRTRSFVYDCANCRPLLRKKCHICGVIGHCATMCPDNWRRYHSTIEDNVPLVQKFKRNNNAKQCSICGRANHQAHNCYVPARIFSCPIPSENVHSYRPIYPFHIGARKSCPPETGSGTKQSDVQARQHEASSRNYEASSCELNLEALIENPNGFYHRFVETMGLLKKQPVPSEQVIVIGTKDFETDEQQQQRGLRVFQRNKKPRIDGHSSSVASPTASDQQKETPGHIKEETNTMLEGVEPTETKADDATAVVTLPEGGITEDSNYSFSELLGADGEAQVSTVNITMPSITPPRPQSENENHPKAELDFIPLNGPSEQEDCNVSQVNSQDEIVEKNSADLAIAKQPTLNAKICLSKENAKLLLSPSGQEFLRLARMKHEVTLMITFELVGNVLHVGGSAAQQDGFRAELVQFLKDQELSAYNKKMILLSSVPKKSQKAVRHITLFFEQLLKPYGNVKKLFDRYIHAQQGGLQLQACERARRTLNMVLFGVYGMREGRSRMNQLIRQVAELKKYQPKQEIDPSLRQIINEHMVYIFSPYDHGNYKQIFTEFQRLNQLQQLKKVTYVELGLPDPILLDMSLYPMVADEEADFKGDDFASQFVEIINPQKTREYNENLMKRQKVPMFANKLAFLITVHFKRLLKRFDSVKNMFHRYVRVQQEVIQSKEVEKARIQLNMVLFGVYGMREGRKRMSQLIQAAGTLKKSTEKLDLSAQKIISENLAYIFSSYDHGNYTKIVAEYQQLRKQQRLSKITAKDLGLKGRLALSTHHCFPLTNTNEVDDHDAFDESNQTEEENDDDGEEVEQQQEQQQPNNPNAGDHDPTKESLILNTFDQMIDPQRLEWLDRASRCHGEEDEDYQMQLQLPQLVENILFSNCSIAPGQRRQQHQHQQQHYLPDRFASVRAASNRVGGRRHRDDRQCANTFTPPNSRWPSSKFNQIMAEQEEKILRCLRLAHSTKGMRHLTDRIDFISKRANRGPLRPIDRSELDKILHILSNKRRHPTQAANRGRRVNARFAPNYRHSY